MKKLIIISALFFVNQVQSQTASQVNNGFLGNTIFGEFVYTRNLSDFKNSFDYSTGGYIGYSIFFSPKNSLDFRTGYISQHLKDSGQQAAGSSMSIIPIHFGGRYYFMNDRVMPFVSFMNGINIIDQKVVGLVTANIEDYTIVRYVWQVGTGLKFGITKKFNFEISANYNSSFYQTDNMMTGLEYSAGFGYVLK